MNSLPSRPLLLPEVTGLPDGAEKIRSTRPLTTIELNDVAAIVLGFVMTTASPGYYALVFERESDSWTTVHKDVYESEDDVDGALQTASDSIFEYWNERSSMSDAVEIETADAVIDEHSMNDLEIDAYLEYFAGSNQQTEA